MTSQPLVDFEPHKRRIAALAASFPSLVDKPGTRPWDALELLRWLCEGGGSSGGKKTARFVLGVWDPNNDWVEVARDNEIANPEQASRFELFEAMRVWDAPHVAAFVAWVQAPFWP